MATCPVRVQQGASAQFQTQLLDYADNPIPATSLTSLKITLTDDRTGAVINGRLGQNALNANNVTVDANGFLLWVLQPADNAVLNPQLGPGDRERHTALFSGTYTASEQVETHAEILVQPNPSAAQNTVCSLDEVLLHVMKRDSASEEEQDFVLKVLAKVERQVKNWLRSEVTLQTFTHLLPVQQTFTNVEPLLYDFDAKGGRVMTATDASLKESRQLALPQKPVRQVLEIRENRGAYGGSGVGDFSAPPLIPGQDYTADFAEMVPQVLISPAPYGASQTNGTARFVTTTAHGLSVGDLVATSMVGGGTGADSNYNRVFAVLEVLDDFTFTVTESQWGLPVNQVATLGPSGGGWVQPLSGICRSGILQRLNLNWPARQRTVRVVYTAGWTADELEYGEASDIKLAMLDAVKWCFSQRGDNAGAVTSESEGDWSASYALKRANHLPRSVFTSLRRYIDYSRFL